MNHSFLRVASLCAGVFFTLTLVCAADVNKPDANYAAVEASSQTVAYAYPRISPKSATYTLKANEQDVFVYSTSAGSFAAFETQGATDISITVSHPVKNVRVAPARHGIKPTVEGNKVRFTVSGPVNLLVEIDGLEHLFVYANQPDPSAPAANAPGVHYFKAGQVYEVGELRLKDNETLYIEGGAVVRGCVRATSVSNVRIAGNGVLDGGFYTRGIDGRRPIVLEDCKKSVIENIIMIEPTSWMIVLGLCEQVTVRNVKQLGSLGSTDGVDIVGSRQIRIENCFMRNGDDCVVIKSLDLSKNKFDASLDYSRDVDDIEVIGCAFLAYLGGQAMEIGHELRTTSITNIRFRDCDVLGVHGQGGVFGIHNTDRGHVSNVLFENIRVEHYYNKLVDFRIIKSRYYKDEERGQIRDVVLRNIDVTVSQFNPGYSISTIGGYDAKHQVKNVLFENFRLNGEKVTNGDQLDLFIKQASGITFK